MATADNCSAVTLQQAVNISGAERHSVRTTESPACHSHATVLKTDSQLHVPRHCISTGHAGMPAQRCIVGLGIGNTGSRFHVYTTGSLMGNRLADCAVGAVSAGSDHQQPVSGLVNTATFRDCSQWSPAQNNCAVLQHSNSSDWSPRHHLVPSCNVNRPVWASRPSPATVNGTDTHCNYASNVRASQVYVRQPCNQMPNQFISNNITAAGIRAVGIPAVSMQQIFMPAQPQRQQIAHNVCHNMSPIQNAPVVYVGQGSTSPLVWQSRFPSQSLNNARLSAGHVTAVAVTGSISQSNSASVTSAAVPGHSPVAVSVNASSSLRNNTVGRVYQLAPPTAAVTTVHSDPTTCNQSPVVTCMGLSTPVSLSTPVVTATKPVVSVKPFSVKPVSMKPFPKAVITPPLPETERTYVPGRRYTMTKEDGVTVEGIWDGKYLTVLTTTAASNTASQTSG